MYDTVKRMRELYGCLQDRQSKDIFWSRLAFDIEPSMTNMMNLCACGGLVNDEQLSNWKPAFQSLTQTGEKIVLYGASIVGRAVAAALQYEHIDFYGFCDRAYAEFPDGLMGKPVISPDELFNHPNQYYVVNSMSLFNYQEIDQLLRKHNFPENRILKYLGAPARNQYFEFPSLYRKGTAFVDCGCYNCGDCYQFVQWSNRQYSCIFAFEPDPSNVKDCQRLLEENPIPNLSLIPAGVSDTAKVVEFGANGGATSHIMRDDLVDTRANVVSNRVIMRTTTIDETVNDETVGLLKMDIEGAELDALYGAKNTIVRDRPLLAICVYHKQGDTLAIMDYLQKLVPDYRFWLRHYGSASTETILYAAV